MTFVLSLQLLLTLSYWSTNRSRGRAVNLVRTQELSLYLQTCALCSCENLYAINSIKKLSSFFFIMKLTRFQIFPFTMHIELCFIHIFFFFNFLNTFKLSSKINEMLFCISSFEKKKYGFKFTLTIDSKHIPITFFLKRLEQAHTLVPQNALL